MRKLKVGEFSIERIRETSSNRLVDYADSFLAVLDEEIPRQPLEKNDLEQGEREKNRLRVLLSRSLG